MPTTGGSLALRGIVPTQDAFQVAQAAPGWRGASRQAQSPRARARSDECQLAWRPDAESVRRDAGAGRIERRLRCRRGRVLRRVHDGNRHQRIDPHTQLAQFDRGPASIAGLSSRAGIIPFGHTQDTGGPMARTVEDIALILDATVGYDAADPTTAASGGRMPRTYTTSLKRGALKGARIGVLTEFFGNAPEDRRGRLGRPPRGRRDEDARRHDGGRGRSRAREAGRRRPTCSPQELKVYLGRLPEERWRVRHVDRRSARDQACTPPTLQGILDVANATPNDYLSSEDYKVSLAARETLGKADHSTVMEREPSRRDRLSDDSPNRAARRWRSTRQQRGAVRQHRISCDHCAGRVHARRLSGRRRADRPSLCRADAARARLRLRAGHAPSSPTGDDTCTRSHQPQAVSAST